MSFAWVPHGTRRGHGWPTETPNETAVPPAPLRTGHTAARAHPKVRSCPRTVQSCTLERLVAARDHAIAVRADVVRAFPTTPPFTEEALVVVQTVAIERLLVALPIRQP